MPVQFHFQGYQSLGFVPRSWDLNINIGILWFALHILGSGRSWFHFVFSCCRLLFPWSIIDLGWICLTDARVNQTYWSNGRSLRCFLQALSSRGRRIIFVPLLVMGIVATFSRCSQLALICLISNYRSTGMGGLAAWCWVAMKSF